MRLRMRPCRRCIPRATLFCSLSAVRSNGRMRNFAPTSPSPVPGRRGRACRISGRTFAHGRWTPALPDWDSPTPWLPPDRARGSASWCPPWEPTRCGKGPNGIRAVLRLDADLIGHVHAPRPGAGDHRHQRQTEQRETTRPQPPHGGHLVALRDFEGVVRGENLPDARDGGRLGLDQDSDLVDGNLHVVQIVLSTR